MMLHKRLFELTKEIRRQIMGKTLIGMLITTTYIGQAILMAKGLAAVFARSPWEVILSIMATVMGIIAIRAGLIWYNELYGKKAAAIVKNKLRQRLYAHLLKLGPGYLEKNRTGKIQSTLVAGVEYLEVYLIYYLPHVLVTVIGAGLILTYIFSLSTVIGFIVITAILIVFYVPRLWNNLMKKYGWSHWQAFSVLNAQFLDSMQGITTLKTFNASERRGKELEADAKLLCGQTMKNLRVSLLKTGVVGLATTSGAAFAVGISALLVVNGQMAIEQLFLLLFLSREVFRPVDELNRFYHQGFLGITASDSIFALLDQEPEIKETGKADAEVKTEGLPGISFNDVEFAYDQGLRPALNKVSFFIKPGETVAIVGESGSGKTTVINLLLRFYDRTNGEISVGGHKIQDYSLETLRSIMAVVSQDTYLFHDTVEGNLRMAKPNASKEEIEAAAKIANIHDFIARLPEGYQTIVGERGVRFSGGERQRMAIARAVLKDAPILLLDEATSSVDTANEQLIQKGIEKLMVNRTTLIIAHRLSTIQNAQRIFVLKAGQIVESGTHAELLGLQGYYAKLIKSQQEGAECA